MASFSAASLRRVQPSSSRDWRSTSNSSTTLRPIRASSSSSRSSAMLGEAISFFSAFRAGEGFGSAR
jgi:hypothetical protein